MRVQVISRQMARRAKRRVVECAAVSQIVRALRGEAMLVLCRTMPDYAAGCSVNLTKRHFARERPIIFTRPPGSVCVEPSSICTMLGP